MDVCIAADPSGNLYIGYTSTTVRVQKLNDARDLEWSITIDNADGWRKPYIAVDSAGAVYMSYEIDLGGGETEVAVAKIAADGSEYLWNRSYGTLVADSSAKVAVDGSDNIVLVFATTGVINGGTAEGGSDVAVFKLDPAGDVLWSLQHPSLNTPGQDTAPTVTVAASGALLVSYHTTQTNTGGEGVVVANVTAGGSVAWTRSFPEANAVPCFLGETPVRTRRGVIPMREVVVGDAVMAAEGGWIPVRRVSVTPTVATERTMPYIVPRGWRPVAGGGGRRKALERFYISPKHCVAVPGRGLVPAMELGLHRSERFREGEVFLYYNLEVDNWANIVVCGLEVESLAPNRVARMPVRQVLARFIEQYGGVDRIPYQTAFKRIRVGADGVATVQLLSKEALAHRAASVQRLTR